MWDRALSVAPPVKSSSKMEIDHPRERTFSSEAEILLKVVQSALNFQQVDTSVVVCRNRSILGNVNLLANLEVSRKKVDIYSISVGDLLSQEFLSLLRDHLQLTPLKFRILLKNPLTDCDELLRYPWSLLKSLLTTLQAFAELRENSGDKKLFDKRVSIRLHNKNNYFSYFRFDSQIIVTHHLGPEFALENSLVHIHWKNDSDKGQKVSPSALAYQDFKRIFKSIWEESPTLVEEAQV